MAFTRKFLKALGITDEQVESIIDAHAEVVDALKNELATVKADSDKVAAVTKERDDLMHKVEELKNKGTDAAKVQAEFDAYKQQVADEKAAATKLDAVKAALKENGVQRPEFIELLLGKVDLANITIEDGAIKDTAFIDTLKGSYAGCFGEVDERGAGSHNPPSGGNQKLTKEAFFKLPLMEQMEYANSHPEEWANFTK